jgi:hypothetical protein
MVNGLNYTTGAQSGSKGWPTDNGYP